MVVFFFVVPSVTAPVVRVVTYPLAAAAAVASFFFQLSLFSRGGFDLSIGFRGSLDFGPEASYGRF